MKKSYLISAIITSAILLAGCSGNSEYTLQPNSHPSLKNKITYLDKKTEWTEPLDKALEVNKDKEESKSGKKSGQEYRNYPSGVNPSNPTDRLFYSKNHAKQEAIHPFLEGFGEIDTKTLDAKTLEVIDIFVSGMKTKTLDMNCISKNSQFLKPVFLYDISQLDEIESYVVGKPFIYKSDNVDEYQIPVRLFTKNAYYDAIFFMTQENGSYLIEQIYYRGLLSE